MIDESKLEKALKELNSKWFQSDRKYRWMLSEEGGRWQIKRHILKANGQNTFQRLPRKLYKNLPKSELDKLITRLNYNEERDKRMRERFQIESAFISSAMLKDFYDLMASEIPTQDVVRQNWSYLERHFLKFFIKLNPNPQIWHSDYQAQWCKYLIELEMAPRCLRSIIQVGNRFMKFLHKKRPNEVPLLEFTPISKARFKKLKAEWDESDRARPGMFIKEADYKKIIKNIPDELKSVFMLCYLYGFRRSEAMGLYDRPECVRKGYILANKQLKQYTREGDIILDTTKGRMARKVPHWYSSPEKAYELISKIVMMCPNEYSRKVHEHIAELDLEYQTHDCRHTFITNAVNVLQRPC